MNRYQNLIQKLAGRQKVQGSNIALFNEPWLISKMMRDDIDFYLMDMEHGRFDTQNLVSLFAMCRALGMPSIVRVQDTAYHLIAKTLDMGADGIMLPRVESLEQLRRAIDAMFYPPVGKKGFGGIGRVRKGETLEQYQKGRVLLPQIESPAGIENLDAMLKQYGEYISGVIVGPMDMSLALGTPLDIYSDQMIKAVQRVFDTCKGHSKSVGIYCAGAEDARFFREMGANILWVSGDLDFLMMGYEAVYAQLAKIE
ncbi:MAG: HpcH/HpaI aldolase family protein [Christensenellales bacterium]|jgi:4-hydroxy-2-oxoheptanedioate aldolase